MVATFQFDPPFSFLFRTFEIQCQQQPQNVFLIIQHRMIPAVWQWVVRPLLLAFQPIHEGLVHGLPRAAAKRFGAAGTPWRSRDVGMAVLLLTILLAAFLALNLFDRSWADR